MNNNSLKVGNDGDLDWQNRAIVLLLNALNCVEMRRKSHLFFSNTAATRGRYTGVRDILYVGYWVSAV